MVTLSEVLDRIDYSASVSDRLQVEDYTNILT